MESAEKPPLRADDSYNVKSTWREVPSVDAKNKTPIVKMAIGVFL